MNRTMERNEHLTEEEFYELLDQPSEAGESKRHLAACERCASEYAAVRESLDGFRLAATGLAEAKFAPVLVSRGGLFRGMRKGMMAWPMGLAAAGVLMAASLMMVHHTGPNVPVRTASTTAASPESDEALLESVNQDLSTSVAPSLEPLSVASMDGVETISQHN